ncbi:MAG TPA: hypothetical protein VJB06_01485 [archaeon]|nr:hypothetical protein [archaeon]
MGLDDIKGDLFPEELETFKGRYGKTDWYPMAFTNNGSLGIFAIQPGSEDAKKSDREYVPESKSRNR